MTTVRCPICGNNFEMEKTTAMPFCSDRCRLIDLGRWLKEGYSVPVEPKYDEDEGMDASQYDEGE